MSLKCGCSQLPQGATIATKDNGNIEKFEMERNNEEAGSTCGCRQRPSSKPLVCKYDYPKNASPKTSITGDCGCLRKIRKHPSQGCCCVRVTTPVDYKQPRPPSRDPICKCGKSPIKELEYQKEMRMRMETEIQNLKLQIADVMQSKTMALNMTKQLKHRYEKIKGIHRDTSSKLESVMRDKEYLCRCLEREKLQNQAMKAARGESGVQVLNKEIDKAAIKTINEQSAKIRSLNSSLQSLSQTVEDKDFEKKKLEREKKQIHEKLKRHTDMTKKLSETNARLAKSVRQKHDSFIAIRSKAGKYQKELSEYKEEVRRSQMELEKLKMKIEKQKNNGDSQQPVKDKDLSNLELKLKKTKDKARRSSETVQLLSQKIRDLEDKQPRLAEKTREMQRVNKDLKTMQIKHDEALKKLKMYEDADQQRTDIVQNELKSVTENLEAKEAAFLQEKETLNKLIKELQSIIDEQKQRIAELEELQKQQDIVIKTQTEQLESKEEQIKLHEKEHDLVKEQCLDLDKQVGNLRSSMDQVQQVGSKTSNAEDKEKIKGLSDEIDSLKAAAQNEKQKSDMKDKVIGEQYHTIQKLKKQLSERNKQVSKLSVSSREANLLVKSSKDQLERVSRQLVKEQEVTRKTAANLQSMQKQKKKLEQNVEDLEEAYQEVSSITSLQRYAKEVKEWEEERNKLIGERDRAIGAAKLATQTLMETMDDFQGQIKSQQKLQKIVTDIIQTKSNQTLSPCLRRKKERERRKNMQVAIPCRPAVPSCNLRCQFTKTYENGFYAASGSSSGASDSDDTAPTPGIYGLLQHVNILPSLPIPNAYSEQSCKCINPRCQCPKSPMALAIPDNNRVQFHPPCNANQPRS